MNNQSFMTTLNKIRENSLCTDGWKKLLSTLGKTTVDDEPLSLLTILDSNGIDDALWCTCAIDGHDRDFRLFAVWCARQVQHLMTDERSLNALDVAEQFATGVASAADQAAARDAAWAAARDAAWAAARDVARAAARAAARDAAWAAAWGAAWDAARAAAWDAAWDAARDAARAAQEARLRKMIADGGWVGSTQPEVAIAKAQGESK